MLIPVLLIFMFDRRYPVNQPKSNRPSTSPKAQFSSAFEDSGARNYEKYFVPVIGAPSAAALLQAADPRPGQRVLDIACGTGIVTRLAAKQIGPDGAITGVDLNPGMLDVARTTVPDTVSADWHQADAAALPLPDESYDLVLCGLSAQFFSDKPAAFHEMHRVLVPGGRVALSLPGRIPPLFAILADAMARHIDPQAGGFVRTVFSLHDPDELERLLTDAGFRDVASRSTPRAFTLPSPKDFFRQYVQSTPLAAVVTTASDATRSALEQDVVEQWQRFVDTGSRDGSMTFRQDLVIAAGRKSRR